MVPPTSASLLGPPVAALNTNIAAAAADSRRTEEASSSSDSDYDSDDSSLPPYRSMAKEALRSGRLLDYASSGDPCVDFFFLIVPGATFGVDWSRENARTALRLVCHLRGVRGLGKGDREGFYAAALWMHALHPKSLPGNVSIFTRFGCLKDLPEILYRLLHGDRPILYRLLHGDRPEQQQQDLHRDSMKRQEEAQLARSPLSRYESDEAFRFIYDGAAEMLAEILKSDVEHLRVGDTAKIGLAAKWCPSLCEAIARRIFPRESNQEYLNISDKHYAYRVRDRLRREVLMPLRKALELAEAYMYARVASLVMNKYKEVFQKHDKHRVPGFFDEVRTGRARMPADAVLPHELIKHDEAAELQWRQRCHRANGEVRNGDKTKMMQWRVQTIPASPEPLPLPPPPLPPLEACMNPVTDDWPSFFSHDNSLANLRAQVAHLEDDENITLGVQASYNTSVIQPVEMSGNDGQACQEWIELSDPSSESDNVNMNPTYDSNEGDHNEQGSGYSASGSSGDDDDNSDEEDDRSGGDEEEESEDDEEEESEEDDNGSDEDEEGSDYLPDYEDDEDDDDEYNALVANQPALPEGVFSAHCVTYVDSIPELTRLDPRIHIIGFGPQLDSSQRRQLWRRGNRHGFDFEPTVLLRWVWRTDLLLDGRNPGNPGESPNEPPVPNPGDYEAEGWTTDEEVMGMGNVY